MQQNKGVRRTANFRCFQRAFIRFHLNESDKFALFGSKMPSASGGLRPPDPLTRGSAWTPLGAPPPDPHIDRHILSVPVLFLTRNEPCWCTLVQITVDSTLLHHRLYVDCRLHLTGADRREL